MIVRKISGALLSANWKELGLELLIVVVGVFLAIQVDNWNDLRKEQNQEKALLQSLLADFEENQEIAVRRLGEYSAAETAALKLLEFTTSERRHDSNDFYTAIADSVFIRAPQFNSNTWDLLTASGQLTTIQSTEIKKSISEFYRRTAAYSVGLQSRVNEKSEALERFVETHLDITRYIYHAHPDDLSFLGFEDGDTVQLDDTAREDLKNLSAGIWHAARDYRGNMAGTLEVRQDIEDSLAEELKRFD